MPGAPAGVVPSVGAVVLSMGDRPAQLSRALTDLLVQRGVVLDVVVVGNGWQPVDLPPGVRAVVLQDNVGIPEGRNIGARAVRGDLLFFYDDDAQLPDDATLQRVTDLLDRHPESAAVQPRVLDPDGRPAPRRWTPRLRAGSVEQAGVATGIVEGLFVIRRAAFDRVGGWPGAFFYSHEGIELVWRVWDAGWNVWYAPDIVVHHPATAPTRHALYYRLNARNRVWVARRNLPAPVALVYVTVWVLITVARVRSGAALRVWFAGLGEGLTSPCGPRRPMRWSTVLRLAKAGRPPVV
jgi:GT2 family glycosyltransferase